MRRRPSWERTFWCSTSSCLLPSPGHPIGDWGVRCMGSCLAPSSALHNFATLLWAGWAWPARRRPPKGGWLVQPYGGSWVLPGLVAHCGGGWRWGSKAKQVCRSLLAVERTWLWFVQACLRLCVVWVRAECLSNGSKLQLLPPWRWRVLSTTFDVGSFNTRPQGAVSSPSKSQHFAYTHRRYLYVYRYIFSAILAVFGRR